ncbi:galanin receptor type 1-like [Clytia hemisphaerica]|uniref:galanin receptor type 1-like n=1 Tax=Clytia hemisphaerica TaxID=252671 RepID=UPI0034D5BABF
MEVTNITYLTLYGLLFIFGVTGNTLIIIFFKFKDKTTKPNYRILIIALAFIDLLSSIYNTIFYQIPMELQKLIIPWYLGHFMCHYSSIISFSMTVVSSNILCLMVGVRYRQLAYPFAESLKKRYLFLGILIGIAISFGTALAVQKPMVLTHGFCGFDFGGDFFNDTKIRDQFYQQTAVTSFVTISIQMFLPLLIILYMTYLTSRLIHHRKKIRFNRNKQFQLADKKTDRLIWMTVKVYFSLIIIPASFSIIQGILMIKAQNFVNDNLMTFMIVGFYCYLLLLCNSVANCFLYAGRVKEFRKFIKRFCCSCTQQKAIYRFNNSPKTSTTTYSSSHTSPNRIPSNPGFDQQQ